VGLGTEILFVLILGLLVLGPKQMHALLGHVARAKSQFEKASRGFCPVSSEDAPAAL
jgi:Sec-independent protein translocase protein TatA